MTYANHNEDATSQHHAFFFFFSFFNIVLLSLSILIYSLGSSSAVAPLITAVDFYSYGRTCTQVLRCHT